jgi:hypothetical protein
METISKRQSQNFHFHFPNISIKIELWCKFKSFSWNVICFFNSIVTNTKIIRLNLLVWFTRRGKNRKFFYQIDLNEKFIFSANTLTLWEDHPKLSALSLKRQMFFFTCLTDKRYKNWLRHNLKFETK